MHLAGRRPPGQRVHGTARPTSTPRRDAVAPIAVAAVVVTVAMIVLGSTVRVTNSGMGCSSWPLCNGQIGPIDRFHALLEQSHRYLATAVSILVLAIAALAWRQRRRRPGVAGPALAAVGTLVLQVGLGALTVVAHNAGWTVGLHLVCAEILLALVAVTAQRAVRTTHQRGADATVVADRAIPFPVGRPRGSPWPPWRALRSRHRDPWAMTMVAVLMATIVAGTLVVDGGAEEACPSWPLCLPGAPGHLIALQLVHRALAAAAGITVLVASWRMLRRRRRAAAGPLLLVALLALQGAAGGITAVLRARAGAADVHLALATLLWLTGVLLAFGRTGEVSARTGEADAYGRRRTAAQTTAGG